jgi:hypothetical protein
MRGILMRENRAVDQWVRRRRAGRRAIPTRRRRPADSVNQQRSVQDLGRGYLRLVARHGTKCLDVNGASTADGGQLIQWTCGIGTNQQLRRT